MRKFLFALFAFLFILPTPTFASIAIPSIPEMTVILSTPLMIIVVASIILALFDFKSALLINMLYIFSSLVIFTVMMLDVDFRSSIFFDQLFLMVMYAAIGLVISLIVSLAWRFIPWFKNKRNILSKIPTSDKYLSSFLMYALVITIGGISMWLMTNWVVRPPFGTWGYIDADPVIVTKMYRMQSDIAFKLFPTLFVICIASILYIAHSLSRKYQLLGKTIR